MCRASRVVGKAVLCSNVSQNISDRCSSEYERVHPVLCKSIPHGYFQELLVLSSGWNSSSCYGCTRVPQLQHTILNKHWGDDAMGLADQNIQTVNRRGRSWEYKLLDIVLELMPIGSGGCRGCWLVRSSVFIKGDRKAIFHSPTNCRWPVHNDNNSYSEPPALLVRVGCYSPVTARRK